jgi:topoisomerase IV subunit A
MALLDGIDEDTVDFRETYNGEDSEPVVLPGAFPNLLANGSSGIAVGMATSIPPHNAAELCDAALHLIRHPAATTAKLPSSSPAPTCRPAASSSSRQSILDAYETGRGSFRVRARWEREDLGRGTWQIVVTEIPYQVQKARLVEKLAELLPSASCRCWPTCATNRPRTSAWCWSPQPHGRSRAADGIAVPADRPGIAAVAQHERAGARPGAHGAVLARRAAPVARPPQGRAGQADPPSPGRDRAALEVLGGLLIAYLNLDEVIRIIREADEPKPALIERFTLTDVQAEAILNMRLRSLRRLEEIEIRASTRRSPPSRARCRRSWRRKTSSGRRSRARSARCASASARTRALGKRRTDFADPPDGGRRSRPGDDREGAGDRRVLREGLDPRRQGPCRRCLGLSYKEGDSGRFVLHATTTDKLVLFASSGKVFTLDVARLPGGRGAGEPVRLMADMEASDAIVALMVHEPGRKLLVASSDGYGFIVAEDDVLATTRKGKQVLNVKLPAEAQACAAVAGRGRPRGGGGRKPQAAGVPAGGAARDGRAAGCGCRSTATGA